MKVKELIKELQLFDGEMEVSFQDFKEHLIINGWFQAKDVVIIQLKRGPIVMKYADIAADIGDKLEYKGYFCKTLAEAGLQDSGVIALKDNKKFIITIQEAKK